MKKIYMAVTIVTIIILTGTCENFFTAWYSPMYQHLETIGEGKQFLGWWGKHKADVDEFMGEEILCWTGG